ncbi:MAG TPA: two-component sensor histidine kinase, partial [Clostridium sp.]|nr:two-component sensor histidine kinase [Clostridium sp.]
MALSSHSRLKEEYYNTRAYEYMSRVIVSSSNESNFLQIAALANASSSYAARIIKNQPFFDKLYSSDDFLWIGLVKDPFTNTGMDQFIPIVRPVSNEFNS